MSGKPPSVDCTVCRVAIAVFFIGLRPKAARPMTAIAVLFVSGPVNEPGSGASHGALVFDRYACQSPSLHCWLVNHAIADTTCPSDFFTLAALSACTASP